MIVITIYCYRSGKWKSIFWNVLRLVCTQIFNTSDIINTDQIPLGSDSFPDQISDIVAVESISATIIGQEKSQVTVSATNIKKIKPILMSERKSYEKKTFPKG